MLFTCLVLIHWFIGCWLCLFGSSLRFGALGLQLAYSYFFVGLILAIFFYLLRLCRVSVLRRQLELFFFYILLLFFGALRC
jgi:hypothetical protein